MKVLISGVAMAALVLGVATGLPGAPPGSATGTAGAKDIVDTAVAAGDFSTLAKALKAADLISTLKGKGPFTVFAPTDEAFAKLPKKTLKSLLKPENKAKLTAILTYHVVPGRVMAKDVVKLSEADTVQGAELAISVKQGKVKVDNATVTGTDIMCSNGVIHVIDCVVLPQDVIEKAAAAGKFKTLAAALKAAGLIETLRGEGPFTVFAPTDDAFAKLPKGTVETLLKPENKAKLTAILTYHVVPGRVLAKDVAKLSSAKTVQGSQIDIRVENGKVYVDDAMVTAVDIKCGNGVIHVIDAVISPD